MNFRPSESQRSPEDKTEKFFNLFPIVRGRLPLGEKHLVLDEVAADGRTKNARSVDFEDRRKTLNGWLKPQQPRLDKGGQFYRYIGCE